MLYDKKWDSQVKPVEPSLKGIIAWLETKNPNEKYDFIDHKNCACAQYLKAINYKIPKRMKSLCLWEIEQILNLPINESYLFVRIQTFGELLSQLKRLDVKTD